MLLDQLNPPMRSGVATEKLVVRLSTVRPSVSTVPSGRAARTAVPGKFRLCNLLNETDGDQVTCAPMSIGFGEKATVGRFSVTERSVRLCCRLAPTFNWPQANRLV